MEYDNQTLYPQRRYPHHRLNDSRGVSQPIFLTICTKIRSPVLANRRAHEILRDLWADRSRWIVGPYVIMPEHSHLIVVEGAHNDTPLSRWIGWWKQHSALRLKPEVLIWQRDYWDTTIVSQAMFAEKIAYMKNNPVKRGLVRHESEWPFQGEIAPLVF